MAGILLVGASLSGCGSSLLASPPTRAVSSPTSAAQPATTTTAPLGGEVAVAFPVVACTTDAGAPLGDGGWKPSILLAPIPTALVGKVEFYSDGVRTVLGPSGWSCAQTQPASGASGLVVYPPGNPNPPVDGSAAAGTQGIFATFDSTADVAGIALVCPYFTVATWQSQEAKCTGAKPAGEQSSMATPDVVAITDPEGVAGSLQGSGGSGPVTGAVIFPQIASAVTDGTSVDVAEESCSLPDPSLCATVLADFEVREFPVPGSTTAPGYRSGYASEPTTTRPVSGGPATTRPVPVPTTTAPPVTATTPTTEAPATAPPASG